MNARAFIVSGARSGSGKTVITVGLQRAFARAGLRVGGAKTGPDYIDPAFHTAATGRPSVNLDGFAMHSSMLAALAARMAAHTDLIVAEGAMGLYDGLPSEDRSGSTASVARMLDWPVLLVLDASGAAQTVAATALGLTRFPGAPPVMGTIVNQIASDRHARMVADGFAKLGVPLLGLIARDPRLVLPARHLGLVQAMETPDLEQRLDAAAAVIEASCDLDAIRDSATPVADATDSPRVRPPGQRIAIARDAAFGFLYPHLLDGWRDAGAEIRFFSPLADEAPPSDCDIVWLPGGYPELHAPKLSVNSVFLNGLRRFALTNPVHGECGGYMVLGDGIEDASGARYAMAGLLPIETSFAKRTLHLGYRRVTWHHAMPFADRGEISVGHEFHYASIVSHGGDALADMADGDGLALGPSGARAGMVTGCFFHLIA